MTANIPPQIANAVIGLFSDPVSVTRLQEKYLEEKTSIENELNSRKFQNQTVEEQNNEIQDSNASMCNVYKLIQEIFEE